MAKITVDEVQSRIASVLDQNPLTSAIDSTVYSLRLKYINIAQDEWAEAFDWQSTYKEYNVLASTSTGNASVVLPSDFRKLASFPLITYSGANTALFPETRPQEAGQYSDTDKRIEILGNHSSNYIMRVYGVDLASGASIKVPYYSSAQSLASPANVSMCPNPDYLVKRTISLWWEAREDPRYPQAKQEAEAILRNLIEYENVFGEASTYDRVKTVEERKYNFRLGRD